MEGLNLIYFKHNECAYLFNSIIFEMCFECFETLLNSSVLDKQ